MSKVTLQQRVSVSCHDDSDDDDDDDDVDKQDCRLPLSFPSWIFSVSQFSSSCVEREEEEEEDRF